MNGNRTPLYSWTFIEEANRWHRIAYLVELEPTPRWAVSPLKMAAVAVAKVAMTSAGELFTRGGHDAAETRGESMVRTSCACTSPGRLSLRPQPFPAPLPAPRHRVVPALYPTHPSPSVA